MTHQQWPVRRIFGALAAPLLMAGLLIGSWPAAASASGCESWTGVQPLSPGTTFNALEGVTVLSPCDAWAVGAEFSGTAEATLIEHWNGSGWTTVPSPNPGTVSNLLVSVRAVSQTNIWAVGSYSDSNSPGVGFLTLVLHWNGLAWKQVPSPNPGAQDNYVLGVRAVSAHDAWAVGYDSGSGGNKTLILRWNGTKWTQVPTPNPGFDNELSGVAATSSGRVGGGLNLHSRRGPDLDPALERRHMETDGQPQPGNRKRTLRRRRNLFGQCVGCWLFCGRHHRREAQPALERSHVDAGGQPQPRWRQQQTVGCGRRLRQQRMGGPQLQRQHAGARFSTAAD